MGHAHGGQQITIGCYIANRGPLATPENIRAAAILAEGLGYYSVALSDHIITPKRVTSSDSSTETHSTTFDSRTAYYELLTSLSFLAGITNRIRLMTHVMVAPVRNPVYAAKILSTLDNLSGGRLIVGIGAGWNEDEFKILGLDYFAHRGTVTSEYIRIFKELWTKDEPRFEGRYYRVSGVHFSPKPQQKPHPPIWVGGLADTAIRRAAVLGDVWFPAGFRRHVSDGKVTREGLRPEDLKRKIAQLHSEAAKAGRDPASLAVGLATDIAFVDAPLGVPRTPFEGTPEQIAHGLREYQQAGVTHFVVLFRCDSPDTTFAAMERFARQVMPLVEAGVATG